MIGKGEHRDMRTDDAAHQGEPDGVGKPDGAGAPGFHGSTGVPAGGEHESPT